MSDIVYTTSASNTPSIASAATAIAANTARKGFAIQNLGTNVLYVRLGSGASTTVFHFALKAGSGNDDGTGGLLVMADGVVYTGIVTVAGTSPRYTVLEMAP
jgi:hypothetical protein